MVERLDISSYIKEVVLSICVMAAVCAPGVRGAGRIKCNFGNISAHIKEAKFIWFVGAGNADFSKGCNFGKVI